MGNSCGQTWLQRQTQGAGNGLGTERGAHRQCAVARRITGGVMNQPANAAAGEVGIGFTNNTTSYAARNTLYWRRNLFICVFGSFTTLVSLSMLLPFLPLYVQQLGVTSQAAIVQWSGVAFGATFLGTAVTAPLWGRLADRYGRKPMLVRAAVGMAIVMSLDRYGAQRDRTGHIAAAGRI